MLEAIYLGKIPEALCDVAMKELLEVESIDGKIKQGNSITNHDIRNTIVRFAPEWHWFNGVLYQLGQMANIQTGWEFYINQRERIQLAEYRTDHHYDWHMDTNVLSGNPVDRKITVVCLMNDPKEFTGGKLELIETKGNTVVPELTKGDVIVFPSFLMHRVTPVESGTRYTATMWLSGPAFR